MKKLLLISYVFPPAGGITVQRALSFAKYLPANGIETHVLTARNPAAPVRDPGLLKHIPPEVRIHRAITPEPPFYLRKKVWSLLEAASVAAASKKSVATPKKQEAPATGSGGLGALVKRLLNPDPQVLWVPFAVRRAASIIRKHKIDCVMVTAPPFSVFLIGNALKRRFPHVKLISDFRDEWLRFYLTDFDFLNDEYTRRRAERIERETIEASDMVIAVTRSSLREIRGRYPEQPDRKFVFLPNGYDPETFRGFTPRRHAGGGMVVTHMGTAYRTASPAFYLDALDEMPAAIRSGVETRFVGRIAETETEIFHNRTSTVKLIGFKPQSEAVALTEESDYLLLTMTNEFSLPGKLFEYLATGKPVLALSPRGGEVDQILQETSGGWCVEHTDRAAIQGMIRDAWESVTGGRSPLQSNREAIRRYERPRLAAELASLIRSL